MMQLIPHHEIDKKKFDQCIANSSNPKIYATSPYMDAVHPGWESLIWGDYEAVCPVTVKRRWLHSRCIQPPFSQQLGVFSKGKDLYQYSRNALEFLQKRYTGGCVQWHDQTTEISPFSGQKRNRKNYLFSFKENPQYRKNHLRAIQKSERAELQLTQVSISDFVPFFAAHNPKYKADIKPFETRFLNLLQNLEDAGMLTLLAATEKHKLIAAVAWGTYQKTAYYLFPAVNQRGRELGANTWLIHRATDHFTAMERIDFEGSEVPGIEHYLLGFDAQLAPYPMYRW